MERQNIGRGAALLHNMEKHCDGEIDLFRISKSKKIVDLSPPTLRSYFKQGLPHYRCGKVVFISKRELDAFIRNPEAFAKKRGAR